MSDTTEVVRRFFAALSSLNPDAWVACFTEDAIFDQPYPPEPGYPVRLEGKAAIHNHVRTIDQVFGRLDFHDIVVHRTEDPALAIATLRSEGTVLATGKPYANEYVAFFRFRDGLVADYREYYNPLKVLESFGGMDALSASFNIEA